MADSAGLLILIALAALLIIQQLNLRVFTRPRGDAAARVSVLIPARDEERSIEACVRSLAAEQPYELIVLDDGSSDRTSEIARSSGAKVIAGQPLPPGWRGKNWACAQLARAATGDLLLFCDADTVHAPQSVRAAAARMLDEKLDLLSLMPRQRCGTFLERLTIPLLDFFYLTFFPAFLLRISDDPRFAAANGQFLLFTRAAYESIGGHASIRSSVVDDLALARRVREARLRLAVADGHELVECRMYRSGAEVIAGFSKNLYAALGESTPRAIGVALMLLGLFVVPPIVAMVTRSWPWIAATLAGLILRLRATRDLFALLHPLSILIAVAVLLRSMLLTLAGRPQLWKGRGAPAE